MWYYVSRFTIALSLFSLMLSCASQGRGERIYNIQTEAVKQGSSAVAHWGWDAKHYTLWGTHSNRLIPVYTFGTQGAGPGIDLDDYTGSKSPYRSPPRILRIYGKLPEETYNETADYLDQTNLFEIQRAAIEAGKKHVILVVFDGMDWQTTWAAAIHRLGRVAYTEGRGTGLHFQDFTADGTTQFGFMVTSPHSNLAQFDVNNQTVTKLSTVFGGYDAKRGGSNAWTPGSDPKYLVSEPKTSSDRQAYTDSASSATSMTTGIKTYNGSINVAPDGQKVVSIAHIAQIEGYAVGAVSSVPISHATPAASYAHNVSRNDYQDLTRDLLGLPSISHPDEPMPGLDVLIGGGYGVIREMNAGQGENFVPGNNYLTDEDLRRSDLKYGGKYVTAVRSPGVSGATRLHEATQEANQKESRLLGFYGVASANGHLPYQTADGDFRTAPGRSKIAEIYTKSDIDDNPTLAQMTKAALSVLQRRPKGFWLMVEAGDVDWANHDNNLDNSIGAVHSGDDAVRVITDWVEKHSDWTETLLIVTADHGHYLFLDRPELLVAPPSTDEIPEAK